jgi:ABC-2 type transport system permease protein
MTIVTCIGDRIEEILVSPVPNYVILLGFVFGGVARGIAVGAIVTLLSLLFTSLQLHHLAVILGMVLLTAILFSIAGLINAIFAESFDDISIIPTFVLTPLTYLGGVFYSIDMLPEFWQAVSRANPILYMVNAFRYGFLGTSDIPVSGAFLMVSAFIVVSYVYALHLLARGRRLRR